MLRDYGGSALDFGAASGCTADRTCGDLAVLRLSFGSVIFFAFIGLLTIGAKSSEDPRIIIHTGLWPVK